MIGTRSFGGMLPRLPDRNLPEKAASVAENVWLDRAYPRPLPALNNPELSISRALGSDNTIWMDARGNWLVWENDVDVAPAPSLDGVSFGGFTISDASNRIVWTGDGAPKFTTDEIAGATVSGDKPIGRNLGVNRPTLAPTLSGVTAPAADDEAESVAYVYTYVTDIGEESAPSPASRVVERKISSDGTYTAVTVENLSPSSQAGVDWIRVYRTVTGSGNNTAFQLVWQEAVVNGETVRSYQFDDSTTSISDVAPAADLGPILQTAEWDPPPSDLTGLIALPNGVLAGFTSNNVIHFSEPYQPHAWPTTYQQAIEHDVVGLGTFGTSVVVGTRRLPFLITGAHPAIMQQSVLEFPHPCVSRRSFANVGQTGAVYASREGLVLVGPGQPALISSEAYRREQWAQLNPERMRSVYRDGVYLAFTDTRAIAIHRDIGVMEIPHQNVEAVHHSERDDEIYILVQETENNLPVHRIYQWRTDVDDDAANRRVMRWRSALMTGRKRSFSAAQVFAEGYPVTFRMYADEQYTSPAVEVNVQNSAPFRIGTGLAGGWQYEVEGQHGVEEVRVGNIKDMIGG